MIRKLSLFFLLSLGFFFTAYPQRCVTEKVMQQIYEEIKTPFKYGLVLVPGDSGKMVDSPSVFRFRNYWFMAFIVFDGKGYETWLAQSDNLLDWKTLGRIMSFTNTGWDASQKAGYIALQDYRWGKSYKISKYGGKYWMSYLGGSSVGYEAGELGIGMAFTRELTRPAEWERLIKPVISAKDEDFRWYDNITLYKSTVIRTRHLINGCSFIMFYNAKGGDKENGKATAERIAMAVSSDMIHWKRFGSSPVIDHDTGISGDAFISKIGDVWVMFYYGAFWKPGAFDRFACSYDLVHWTPWKGEDLIRSSEEYDSKYAHKPFVIKHKGVVYHFYCAVDDKGNRGIAVATSKYLGKSDLWFSYK